MKAKVDTDILKYISIAITTIVGLWSSIDFITDKLDKHIDEKVNKSVEIAFKKYEHAYMIKLEKRVGRFIDPIEELANQINKKDSIKIVYERIIPFIREKSDYSVMGLHINKKTKERIYTDSNGIDYKVYLIEEGKDKGRMYYFNGKQIVFI